MDEDGNGLCGINGYPVLPILLEAPAVGPSSIHGELTDRSAASMQPTKKNAGLLTISLGVSLIVCMKMYDCCMLSGPLRTHGVLSKQLAHHLRGFDHLRCDLLHLLQREPVRRTGYGQRCRQLP